MIMTALMIFLGVSAFMSLFIISGVVVGARRAVPTGELSDVAEPIAASARRHTNSEVGASLLPAFSH